MKYFPKLSQWPKHSDKNHKDRLINSWNNACKF